MSDTPRTDAAIQRSCIDDLKCEWVEVEFARKLERENAALRADKERLDWLGVGCSCDFSWIGKEAPPSALTSLRNAIDWAMKEAQP
jgi:hypothetical protein